MSLASPAKKTNIYKSCCSLELHRNSQKNIHSKVQFFKKLHALSRKFRKKKLISECLRTYVLYEIYKGETSCENLSPVFPNVNQNKFLSYKTL